MNIIDKMTDVAALRTYLKAIVGLGNKSESAARPDAIIEEGFASLTDIVDLYDDGGLETVCAKVQSQQALLIKPFGQRLIQIPKPGKSIPPLCKSWHLMEQKYTHRSDKTLNQ